MRLSLLIVSLLLPLGVAAQDKPGPEERLKSLENRLERLEGAPAKYSPAAFNPSLGLALDLAARHSDDKAGFLLRAAELNLDAPIDPFLKGWAIITANNGGVDLEEAALQTTALPYNLTVRAGRLFAAFGRLGHFHDHELPVIDRPASLDAFIGGESQADGLEVSALMPLETYAALTFGAYNKIGGDNTRQANASSRAYSEMTYLGRLVASKDLGDDHSAELGVSVAWTPKRVISPDPANTPVTDIAVKNTWRALGGLDFTYRYHPIQGGLYRGAIWGTEVFVNNEARFDPLTRLPVDRVKAFAGYSYAQLKIGRRWRPGVMIDLTEDLDSARQLTRTYTAFLTYDVTEFQRLRASYARAANNVDGRLASDTVGLQWTGVLGRHVHGFRDR